MDRKKIRVRKAKASDRGLFKKLWKQYLEEQYEAGHYITPSDNNVEVFTQIFDKYVNEEAKGEVLFVAEEAVLMVGELTSPFETNLGKTANVWGIFSSNDEVKSRLISRGSQLLKEQKFETMQHICCHAEPDWETKLTVGTFKL